MSQVSKLKSAQIAALDTYQPGGDQLSTGFGAQGYMRSVSGSIVPIAADAAGTTYQMVRVPTNCVVKQVLLASQAQGAGAVDIGVYYSTSTIDGTPVANQGTVIASTGKTFFASQISLAGAVAQTDETFQNAATGGAYNEGMINKRLWDALGLTTDPGGQFDIVLTVDTTAITTGTGLVSLTVNFID